jgi:triacylglycerol lipase
MSWSYPQGFEAAQAVAYANFCQQAYFQYYVLNKIPPEFGYPPFSQIMQLPPSGYRRLYNIWEAKSEYFGYVAGAVPPDPPNQIVIALRGTEGWGEWFSDLMLSGQAKCPVNGSRGSVHEGFATSYSGLGYYAQPTVAPPTGSSVPLSTVLAGARTVVVTGHSLGAALGTLLTLDIALNIAPKVKCSVASYNFASPMVGDPIFAGFVNELLRKKAISANYRVANGMDVVPNLPPNVFYPPAQSQECDYMQVDGYCPVDSGILSILSDAHSLSNYVIGLNNLKAVQDGATISRPASATRMAPPVAT